MANDNHSSVFLQYQVQKNAEELNNYVQDLNNWEKDMKQKDEELRNDIDVNSKKMPPVRNKHNRMKNAKAVEHLKKDISSKKERIKSYDYSSWEKFDIDKACADLDEENNSDNPVNDDNDQCCTEKNADYECFTEENEIFKNKQQAILEKDKGNEFFKNGKYKEAIESYTVGILCDASNAVLPANRAMAYIKQKNYNAAESDCTLSLSLDPTYIKAYQRRAVCRMELDKLEEAKQDLKEVLKLDPLNKQAQGDLKKIEQRLTIFLNPPSKTNLSLKPIISENILLARSSSNKSFDCQMSDRSSLEKTDANKLNNVNETLNIVKPIYKLPHLRSKKSLKRIEVEEVDGDIENIPKVTKESKKKLIPEINVMPLSSPDQELISAIPIVPELPKTEYQFQSSLKRLKHHQTQLFQYLIKIDPKTYPKLLQESMEFEVFSIILQYLHEDLLPKNKDVYSHLYYLSKVKRFNALVLFITKDDKQILTELFEYIKQQPMSNIDNVQDLANKYGL